MAKRTLLKVWDDWSDGVGFPQDDDRTAGLSFASAMVGMKGQLSPAVKQTDIELGLTDVEAVYFFDDVNDLGNEAVWALLNPADGSSSDPTIAKIVSGSLNGTTTKTPLANSSILRWGQPALYAGKWHFPLSGWDNANIRSYIYRLNIWSQITPPGNDNYSVTSASTDAGGGATHLAMLNHQLARVTTASGASILAEDGDAIVTAETNDWGAYFPVGVDDYRNMPFSLLSLGNLMFVLKRDGMFSFNNVGRAGRVLEDLPNWKYYQILGQGGLAAEEWRDGLLFTHNTGLYWWKPGSPPQNLGIGSDTFSLSVSPPSNATSLDGGLHVGLAVLGDKLFTMYQTADKNVFLFQGTYIPNTGAIGWQCLAELGIDNNTHIGSLYGVHVQGGSVESTNTTRLWFRNGADVSYIPMGPHGNPNATPNNKQKIVTSGTAEFSELFFPTPVDLDEITVYTQDMAAGDQFNVSLLVNGQNDFVQVGAPIIGNGRQVRRIDRQQVHRAMVRVDFAGTDASSRTPPSIKRVELWGDVS